MSLKKKLNQWLTEGIITSEQATAIINREKSRFSIFGKLQSVYGFLTVASISISLGALSLISANWAVISSEIKLFVYFLLMGGLSVLALKLKNKSELWFSALLVLFMFLCLGGIGLIAQIYNLKGESWQALLLWSVMTSSLMLISHKKITSHIWLCGFSLSLFLWTLSVDKHLIALTGFLFIYFLLFMFLSLLFRAPQMILPVFVKRNQSVFEKWTVIMGVLNLVNFNMIDHLVGKSSFFDESLTYITLSVFLIILIFLFLCVNAYTVYYSNYKKIQKILLGALLSLYVLFFIEVWSSSNDNSLINLLFSLLILFCSGLFSVSLKNKTLFKLSILALIGRLCFFYIETFQSLIHTGISLILIGLIIVFLFVFFQKNTEKIMKWVKKLE